jgi:hypothetical protein
VVKRTAIALAICLFATISPASSDAQSIFDDLSFGLDAGFSVPMGDAADYHSMGLVVGLNCFYEYSENFQYGVRFAFNRWGIDDAGWTGDDVDGSSSMMEFIPQVKYIFPRDEMSKFGFFGQGGIGFYRYAFDVDVTVDPLPTVNYNDSDFNLGICLGGGLTIEGGGREWNITPMFNMVFTDNESTTYMTITIGTYF